MNASVKAYFALKLAGHSADLPFMHEARANILRLGGIPKMNTFSKLYLALLGQFPWQYLPSIPVEMVLLPNWAFFNIYKMSSWSRAMLVPLAIINHFKPTRELPGMKQLHELYPLGTEHKDFTLPRDPRFFAWRNFFLRADHAIKIISKLGWRPMRRRALEEAERWMVERIGEGSDGLAAVFPAMLNCLIALRVLGYSPRHPIYEKAAKDFAGLFVDDPEDFRIQPCMSPVWDTSINIIALAESGLPAEHPALKKAATWLVEKEVRVRGDWTMNNPHPEASGWAFEYNNVYYPDTDDTAMVLMALRLARPDDQAAFDALVPPRDRVATQFPMPRWRLGGVRQGNHQALAGRHAVRGPQRDPRPNLQRPDGAHPRAARLHQFRCLEALRARRGPTPDRYPGRRWLVVRPLGRELHLWDLAGSARPARHRRKHDAGLDPARPRLAGELPERRWRLGRNLRLLRRLRC